MFWYPWSLGFVPGFIFPMLMCIGMMVMMLFMMRGHMWGLGFMHRDDDDPREADHDRALDTLRQRFASGELTSEQYEEQRKVLLAA